MIVHAPREIASAVQGYVKALRLLGRENTSIAAIADALHVTDTEVEIALKDFKITGAKYCDKKTKVLHLRHDTIWSSVIRLKK